LQQITRREHGRPLLHEQLHQPDHGHLVGQRQRQGQGQGQGQGQRTGQQVEALGYRLADMLLEPR